MFAKIALDGLDRLSALRPNRDGEVSGMSWRQLAEDVELRHEVALARGYASAGQGRARA